MASGAHDEWRSKHVHRLRPLAAVDCGLSGNSLLFAVKTEEYGGERPELGALVTRARREFN